MVIDATPHGDIAGAVSVYLSDRNSTSSRDSLMPKQVWIRDGDNVQGPMQPSDLKRRAAEGRLQPRHQISFDRLNWRFAEEVKGLSFGSNGTDREAHEDVSPTASDSPGLETLSPRPSLVGLGVAVLAVTALAAIAFCVTQFGLLVGFVVSLLFLLVAVLGYPAVCLGWELSGLYLILMTVGAIVVVSDAPAVNLSAVVVLVASLLPGAAALCGWRLVVNGLGYDYRRPRLQQQDLARFRTRALAAGEVKRALQATSTPEQKDAPRRVKIRLDPDDLLRDDPTIAEKLEAGAKRGWRGLAVSVGFHAVLLAVLAVFHIRRAAEGEVIELQSGLTTGEDAKAAEQVPKETGPVELKGMDFPKTNTQQPSENKEPAAQGNDPGPPVKPVAVKGFLEGRTEEQRKKILGELDDGEKIELAISLGLGWLGRHQLESGNWQMHEGYPNPAERVFRTDTGATALALLAYLGHGQTHTDAKDDRTKETVRKGIEWLRRIQKKNGDFHDSEELGRQTAFYAHSQATIAICEAYILTNDRSLIEPAERGVRFLLKSQQPIDGGWKYQPQDARSVGDLSVTGWALMALHTARAAGINVADEPFQRATKFLNSVQEENGARYKYEPRPGQTVSRAMTAEGLLCRLYLGWPHDHPSVMDGADFLTRPEHMPEWSNGKRNVYEWYYTGQMLHTLADERFKPWYDTLAKQIVEKQMRAGQSRGSWSPLQPDGARYEYAREAGRLYISCMTLLLLELPYRHQLAAAE